MHPPIPLFNPAPVSPEAGAVHFHAANSLLPRRLPPVAGSHFIRLKCGFEWQ